MRVEPPTERFSEEDTHMTDPPHYPDPEPHTTPRWVKVFGTIALVVVLLFVILLLVRGPHRPGRHMSGGDMPGSHTSPVQHGVQQP